VDLWDGDCGVHGLCEGVLKEVDVGPSQNASVVRDELYIHDFSVVGAGYGDGSGKANFDRVSVVASMSYEW